MFSMLLVDDEMDQVDSLAETIDWKSVGIERIYKAYSAMEALEIMETSAIDIVITDIRMPEMSGIELIQKLTEHWSHIQVIILSGYSDFKYAQSAVKHNVSEYLLKPVSDEEIIEAVTRTCSKLKDFQKSYHSSQKQIQLINQKLPIIKSTLLNDLLDGKMIHQSELDDIESTYGIHFSNGDLVYLVLIRLEGKFARYNDSDKALISFSIFNMVDELLVDEFEVWHSREKLGYLVIMLKPKHKSVASHEEKASVGLMITKYVEQLQRAVQFYLQGQISVLISGCFVFQEELQEVYRQNLSKFRNLIGELEGILISEESNDEGSKETPLQKMYESITLLQLMELGKWSQAKGKLDEVIGELLNKWPNSHEHLLEVFYAFSHAVMQYAHSNGLTTSQIDDSQENLSGKGFHFHSARHFQEWAVTLLDKLNGLTEDNFKVGRSRLVEQINQYIEAHYGEDATLQALSDHVGLHPSYLSKLYKLETGQGISEYRHRLRMNKSIELLKQNQYKIHEISEMLGFQNPQYFSKRFKEEFGCTPNEFREDIV